jgi:hypothetical protein
VYHFANHERPRGIFWGGIILCTTHLAEGEMGAKLGGFRIEANCTWWFYRDEEVMDTSSCQILRRQFRGS